MQIKARGSSIRGHFKDMARKVIAGTSGYAFTDKTTKKAIRKNKQLADALLDENAFIYKVSLFSISFVSFVNN